MHELSVTQSLLQLALNHADGGRITDLYLVIGPLSSMVDNSVQFYWDMISEGTAAANSRLHFKRTAAEIQCQDCQKRYPLASDDFTCPNCGSAQVRVVSGDEFYLESIEVIPLEQMTT
jgi:hydrogenase nickel incorporation protein HypA/HybF